MRNPFDETAFFVERNNRIGTDVCERDEGDESVIGVEVWWRDLLLTEFPATSFRVFLEQFDDHRVELHESSILAKIVFRFAQEAVELTVATLNRNLARFLQRAHDRDLILESWTRRRLRVQLTERRT